MPGGRPTKYKAEHCEQVIDHFREGWSIAEICLELDICEKTFLNWVNTKDEFLQAKKKGVFFSEGWWMKQGRKNLENKEFNSTLWYMNMKNRFGWKDRNDLTTNDKEIQPVVVNLGTGIKPDETTS